jgi:hypothetical protein
MAVMSRPAKGHTGRQRKLACSCGFICYASAGAIRKRGVPVCACGEPLTIAHMRDAVKVSPGHAAVLALEQQEREQHAYDEWSERDAKRAQKAGERAEREGFKSGAFNCFVCGKFKPSPAAQCHHCGDRPAPMDEDPNARREFNRAYGYAA